MRFCTAGGSYLPVMADEAVIVGGTGSNFLAGPALVRTATGEEVDIESLEGESVHGPVPGVVDHVSDDDHNALAIVRQALRTLFLPVFPRPATPPADPTRFPSSELGGLMPASGSPPVDVREVLVHIVDDGRISEFKSFNARTLVTVFASLSDMFGIVAFNGVLFNVSALKCAHFVQLCASCDIPLLFIQKISGFVVDRHVEAQGLDGERRRARTRAANNAGHRWLAQSGDMLYVRTGVHAGLPVHVADFARERHGRPAGSGRSREYSAE